MILRLLVGFVLLFAGVWAGVKFHQDPGYLLISFHQWTIETTLWVGVFILLIVFFLVHVFLLLIHWLLALPKTFHRWWAQYRLQRAHKKTEKGLIEFGEGYWSRAHQHLTKALPDTDVPLLNYLTAARAAQEMGESSVRDDYLQQAQTLIPDAKIAVELTQAELQLANHEWDSALVTLKNLQEIAPHHPHFLKLLSQFYHERAEWTPLITLLPDLKYYRVFPAEIFNKLQKETYLRAMLEQVRLNDREALEKIVTALPKALTTDPSLMAIYCEFLLQRQEDKAAEALLRRCLQQQYDETLVSLYGQLRLGKGPLNFAESLLKKYSYSSAIYLCLGRLSQRASLWGKAKHYFEESIRIKPSAEAYAELGELLQQLGDIEETCKAFRAGLKLAINAH